MFSWDHYTKVAKSLQKYAKINSTVTEGFYRSAVSRAYYAAYHAALAYARGKGYEEHSYRKNLRRMQKAGHQIGKIGGSHSVLAHFLLQDSHPEVKFLGATLRNCTAKRHECDYDRSVTVNERYARVAFLETNSIQPH